MSNVKGKDNYAVMPQLNSVDIVPPGGSTGQVLTKVNATNYNYSWQALPASGKLVRQLVFNIAPQSGTSSIPYDNTTPLIGEGTQIWSQSITPSSATNVLRFGFAGAFDTSSNSRGVLMVLFRGNTCIDSNVGWSASSGNANQYNWAFTDAPATTSATTYSIRVGLWNGGGSWFIGQGSGGVSLNGTLISQLDVMEIAV